MSRFKIESTKVSTKLASWDEVGLSLKEIAEYQSAINKIETELNDKISDLKLDASLQTKPYIEKIQQKELEVKEFTESNKHEIKGKSKKLDFGKVGFRSSTKIVINCIQDAIKRLRDMKLDECIKVKTTQTIDTSRLKDYPDKILETVGAERIVKDTFYYEIDKQKLS